MPVRSFRDLVVWQKSFKLAERVYARTRDFPAEEKFGLSSQIQRSASSIPSNIAEGCTRNNRGEYIQFIGIARGSSAELETQMMLAQSVYNLDFSEELKLLNEIQRMLTSLNQKLRV